MYSYHVSSNLKGHKKKKQTVCFNIFAIYNPKWQPKTSLDLNAKLRLPRLFFFSYQKTNSKFNLGETRGLK